MVNLDELGLCIDLPFVHPESLNFRPPSWPPPDDWVPLRDAEGMPLCHYRDSIWPLDVWAGYQLKINFGDGHKGRVQRIDSANADLLRQMVTWRIWGPRGIRKIASLRNFLLPVRKIVALCSREGILASDLMRFPNVAAKVPQVLAGAHFNTALNELQNLLDSRDALGFVLFDRDGLSRLARSYLGHDSKQTAYIPARIWAYQINRLRECLDDYLAHREQFEACFHFCVDAFAKNDGSLTAAVAFSKIRRNSPFQNPASSGVNGQRNGATIYGPFELTAKRFGIDSLLNRWVGEDRDVNGKPSLGIRRLVPFMHLISNAGLAYLLNLSLMRLNEGWNLRADCLMVEKDEKLGDIYLLCGETTKTDPDADARWPTSPNAKVAVNAMASIARMRMRCAAANPNVSPTSYDIANPYLICRSYEPWAQSFQGAYSTRPVAKSYCIIAAAYPLLLDQEQLRITEQDLQLARLIEPGLDPNVFKVGAIWPLAYHQLRRTGAVNMLSSGLVSESSLQYQLKHLSRVMTLYYGHNYSRLALDSESRGFFLRSMYQSIGRELASVLSDRFVSPLGDLRKNQVVQFIKVSDAKKLEAAARKGELSCRQIRLGFCMKRGACQYGGVESIAHCTGGDSGVPCPDLLLDRELEQQARRYDSDLGRRVESAPVGSPRQNALLAEKRGMEKFFEAIR